MLTVKPCILIADDEEDILGLVKPNLCAAGFRVLEAMNGPYALELSRREVPALAVLDHLMPGMTGLEVCRALKSNPATERISIVMLTAKATDIDRVLAFELGADDFVTKPFSPRELVLRVQAILRRKACPAPRNPVLTVGDIALDLDQHRTTVRGKPVELTGVEFKLLTVLLERTGRVQSRDALLDTIWGIEHDIDIRTVDTHLRRLRDKLGCGGDQIHTVRGIGYRLDEC